MAVVSCSKICFAAALATLTDAALVYRQPAANLVAPAANSSSMVSEQMLQGAFSGFYALREAAVPAAALSAGGKDTQKEEQPPQGINMQVPEKELKELMAQLSAKCEKQFSAIIHGQGPGMHMYGVPAGGKSPTCKELDGVSCLMDAHVTQEKTTNGRSMSSTTTVSGKGCLPESCNEGKDLEVLAGFMQGKAKEALPGPDVNVHLSVDCSKAKGSVVAVGTDARKPPRAGKLPKSKKGAAERSMMPGVSALVAVIAAALSHSA